MPTTIKLKNSVTTTSVPSSLVQGEVAINITDKKVWVGNAATTPIQIAGAGTTGNAAGSNTQVQYNSSGSFAGSANFTFNGTTVTMANDASISGLTVGKGAGSVSTNTVVGNNSLVANTTGASCTAVGADSLTANTTGRNTAYGRYSLSLNTTGTLNTGIGDNALYSNTTGGNNVAVGYQALAFNTTASYNTAVGGEALKANTTAQFNCAVGFQSLRDNTTGADNTAIGGYQTLIVNTTGSNNTAVGRAALASNTTASSNTALGKNAGFTNTGAANTFVGKDAGYSLTTGARNTFVGCEGASGGCGDQITTGSKNSIFGGYNGNQGGLDIRTASNRIVLSDGDGNPRVHIDDIGRPFIPSVYTYTTASAANINVNTDGLMQRSTSSLKYKKNVQDAVHGLSDVLKLRSVTYESKNQTEEGTVYGGLIAEEIHDAGLTEFVQYATDGSPDAIAYGNMVSLCVKAIQELNAKVEAQALEIATLKGN